MNRGLADKADSLLAIEKGTVRKEWGGRVSVCLVYPNTYYVGMSNLGFQGIYGLLNGFNEVVCERAFLPDAPDIEEYRRTGTPIFSLESKRPLDRFDILCFSLSYENDYPNVARILDLARIPLLSSHRLQRAPLMVAGGACCFFNPEPVADIFDIIFVGEAEESLREFLDVYLNHESTRTGDGGGRLSLLKSLLQIEGIYVPSFYEIGYAADGSLRTRTALHGAPRMITRRYVADLSGTTIGTAIVTSETEFSDRYLVEAMRGCPWRCRFCVVGRIYSPVRIRKPDDITREIGNALRLTDRVGVISPSLSDYPHIREVLCMEGVEFSITSLRTHRKTLDLIGMLRNRKSISIAPEAGTVRMRAVIDKRISEEEILETARALSDAGIPNIRLYFMIGLPTETTEDVLGIAGLVRKIRESADRGALTASVSTFVPKPFTPFQWHPMESLASLKSKLSVIRKSLRDLRQTRVVHDVPKYALMQGLFARGDRRIAPMLGAMVTTDDWQKASRDTGIDADSYLFRQRDREEMLPWDFIDNGVPAGLLWDDYSMALSQR